MECGRVSWGDHHGSLTRRHVSARRNPIIADVFYRTGLIGSGGKGTNRVIAEYERHGIAPPVFEIPTNARNQQRCPIVIPAKAGIQERQGFVVVTFRTPIVWRQPESQPESLAQRVLVSTCRTVRYLQVASRGVIPAHAGIQIGPMGSCFRGSDEKLRGLAPAQG
jgi:hypothetical protein